MATDTELMTMPYTDFVAGLFVKPETFAGKLAHAAVGMVGEVVELMGAVDRAEALEELGDWMFYAEAFWQTLAGVPGPAGVYTKRFPATQQAAMKVLLEESTALMDLAKKVWIYAKTVPQADFQGHMLNADYAFNIILQHLGVTPDFIEVGNRAKLIKRYPGATYTDAAAQARADKVEVAVEVEVVAAPTPLARDAGKLMRDAVADSEGGEA